MHDIDEAARQERRGTKWKRSRYNGECSAEVLAGSVESTGQQRRRKTTSTSTTLVRIHFRFIQAFRLSGGKSENIQYRRIRNSPSEGWSDAERIKKYIKPGFYTIYWKYLLILFPHRRRWSSESAQTGGLLWWYQLCQLCQAWCVIDPRI